MPRPTRETIKYYIDSVNNEGRNLDLWERQFMESVTDRFDGGGNLSEKQEEVLVRIYEERV